MSAKLLQILEHCGLTFLGLLYLPVEGLLDLAMRRMRDPAIDQCFLDDFKGGISEHAAMQNASKYRQELGCAPRWTYAIWELLGFIVLVGWPLLILGVLPFSLYLYFG